MKFILGTKEGMTQCFDEAGICHGATIVRVSPLTVTQVKTAEKDGYEAVQLAGGEKKERGMTKAVLGHLGSAKRYVREFRGTESGMEKGATVDVSIFAPGDVISVAAISKGKGFQGVVKRHGFGGDFASHGRKHSLRMPGSIGGGGRAGGRVIKGMRMGGRMGSDRVTVKNLKVLQVNASEQLLLIKGAIPGRKGTLVEIRGI